MAQKVINVPEIGPVTLQKRAGTGSVRIHIQGSRVKVTMPSRVPYVFAEKFLQSRKQWILENIEQSAPILDAAYIGKQHQVKIQYKDTSRPSSRVSDTQISITLPVGLPQDSSEAQRIIVKACEKALRQETEQLLIPRLQDLAYENEITMKSATVKRLRSRWGSCDSHKNIVLNSYLAQLPWPLIDYVLVHELSHTRHLNHSPEFWKEVATILPDYKERRKATRTHSPHVITT
jgi:predicted metal-dependent hydrolase